MSRQLSSAKLHLVQSLKMDDLDIRFFKTYPDRQAHIRRPALNELAAEFHSLGDHQPDRRRVLLWRIPPHNPHYHPVKRPLMKIPFLAFADETIEDRDDVLLPLIHTIMMEAAQ